ncbi:MAG: hypothetical protein NTW11_01280 [Candidatus Staskawiczbacteria bacterium]|nr:hypothetical protein [Candidatus Staskawiczbacteria bacterium]
MSLQDKKEELESQEKPVPFGEQAVVEQEKIPESKEAIRDEKEVSDELKREIELMQVDDSLKKQAEQKANKISFLADDDKLKQLMAVAREKGVVFAIKVAKTMNDPFLLDTLHDALAREGYYKDFVK